MPRILKSLGPAYRIEVRTLERLDHDLLQHLDTVGVRLTMWKQTHSMQRWVGLELLNGHHAGLEIYIPVEAMQGENTTEMAQPVGATIIE